MPRIPTMELEVIVSNRPSAPSVIRSLECFNTGIIRQFHDAAQMVFVRVIDLVQLPQLFHIYSSQPIAAANIAHFFRNSAFRNDFIVTGKNDSPCRSIVLLQN